MVTSARTSSTLTALGQVAVGSMVANVAAYLVHLPASRWLAPDAYGEFAVLLQSILILGVPALALQAVAAREMVTGTPVRVIVALGLRTAAVVSVMAAVALWPMMAIAHTGFWATLAAFTCAPLLVLISVGQGILQGHNQFHTLAWVIAMVGMVRAIPAIAVLAAGAGPAGALAASATGTAVAAAVVGWRAIGGATSVGGVISEARASAAMSVVSVVQATQVQLVLVVASSIDLVMARVVLSANDSGVYALGTIATKVAFWLPQAVALVVFPRLADAQRSPRALRRSVAVLVVLGGASALAALIGGPLVPVVVGPDYRPVAGLLWLFALTGAALAVLQVALLAAIARHRTHISVVAWVVVVVEVLLMLTLAHSVAGLAVIAAGAAAVSATLTVALALRPGAACVSPGVEGT
ncbi:polysaccharide biosynthesis protein [Williamsia sp. CHRR-6]|uniref:polysaccharide biosynthesis protein n=1 Tax=Williamsia sp. CHRR-6 TaxID=2835871 RepID=UPI001BD9D0E6|nr:polysaccharide biosynthesis protein [Williamsia sp. CHRR-6]MBT0567476.1 polysaccharide biosynthesis protein [Williamsia sp. CHRR-6]